MEFRVLSHDYEGNGTKYMHAKMRKACCLLRECKRSERGSTGNTENGEVLSLVTAISIKTMVQLRSAKRDASFLKAQNRARKVWRPKTDTGDK